MGLKGQAGWVGEWVWLGRGDSEGGWAGRAGSDGVGVMLGREGHGRGGVGGAVSTPSFKPYPIIVELASPCV